VSNEIKQVKPNFQQCIAISVQKVKKSVKKTGKMIASFPAKTATFSLS